MKVLKIVGKIFFSVVLALLAMASGCGSCLVLMIGGAPHPELGVSYSEPDNPLPSGGGLIFLVIWVLMLGIAFISLSGAIGIWSKKREEKLVS